MQNLIILSYWICSDYINVLLNILKSFIKYEFLFKFQDKYVLLSLVILCVVCIWHAVVTVFMHHGSNFLSGDYQLPVLY